MIRLPIYPPTATSTQCYQLRIYQMKEGREVEPDVWVMQDKWGAGYWHFRHTKECDRRRGVQCGARGWLYWQDGVTEEDARINLAQHLLKVIRPRMQDEYDRVFTEGPWNSIGLYTWQEE